MVQGRAHCRGEGGKGEKEKVRHWENKRKRGAPETLRRPYKLILWGASVVFLCAFAPMQDERFLVPDDPWGIMRRPVQTIERKTLRVDWERTGGFAGMRMAATIDSESLKKRKKQRKKKMKISRAIRNP